MSCLLCHGSEAKELFRGTDRLYRTTDRQFPVVRCRNCGLVRMEPRPAGAELAGYYPRHYWFAPGQSLAGSLEERYRRFLIQDHVRFVERALRDAGGAGPVLDVGCGGGLLLHVLRQRNQVAVMGLDASAEAASLAWRYNRVPAFQGDLTAAPLGPRSCSVITMFHVMEHLPDPRGYLQACRELLRASGRLVVQVPNMDCWQYKALGTRWSGLDVPRHLQNFRSSDLTRLLDQEGFTVVRTKHFSWRDNPAGLATSLVPALEPVARRVRGLDRSPLQSLVKDAAYFALVLSALPFTLAEAAAGAGSTVMVEARRKL